MNKRHYEHTLPNIRGSLSNAYLSITADTLEFINTGKREGAASDTGDTTEAADDVPAPPTDAPQDDKDDLPF